MYTIHGKRNVHVVFPCLLILIVLYYLWLLNRMYIVDSICVRDAYSTEPAHTT